MKLLIPGLALFTAAIQPNGYVWSSQRSGSRAPLTLRNDRQPISSELFKRGKFLKAHFGSTSNRASLALSVSKIGTLETYVGSNSMEGGTQTVQFRFLSPASSLGTSRLFCAHSLSSRSSGWIGGITLGGLALGIHLPMHRLSDLSRDIRNPGLFLTLNLKHNGKLNAKDGRLGLLPDNLTYAMAGSSEKQKEEAGAGEASSKLGEKTVPLKGGASVASSSSDSQKMIAFETYKRCVEADLLDFRGGKVERGINMGYKIRTCFEALISVMQAERLWYETSLELKQLYSLTVRDRYGRLKQLSLDESDLKFCQGLANYFKPQKGGKVGSRSTAAFKLIDTVIDQALGVCGLPRNYFPRPLKTNILNALVEGKEEELKISWRSVVPSERATVKPEEWCKFSETFSQLNAIASAWLVSGRPQKNRSLSSVATYIPCQVFMDLKFALRDSIFSGGQYATLDPAAFLGGQKTLVKNVRERLSKGARKIQALKGMAEEILSDLGVKGPPSALVALAHQAKLSESSGSNENDPWASRRIDRLRSGRHEVKASEPIAFWQTVYSALDSMEKNYASIDGSESLSVEHIMIGNEAVSQLSKAVEELKRSWDSMNFEVSLISAFITLKASLKASNYRLAQVEEDLAEKLSYFDRHDRRVASDYLAEQLGEVRAEFEKIQGFLDENLVTRTQKYEKKLVLRELAAYEEMESGMRSAFNLLQKLESAVQEAEPFLKRI